MFVCESVRKGEGERESTRVKEKGEKNQLRERREEREERKKERERIIKNKNTILP